LIKGPIKLPDIMAIAGSDFREMNPLLVLLAERRPDQIYVLRRFEDEHRQFNPKLDLEKVKKDLKDLNYDV